MPRPCVLAATLLIALAGCGEGEGGYVEEINGIQEPLLATIERTTADLERSEDPDSALSEAASAAREASSDLRDLDPPSAVTEHNEQLAEAYYTASILLEDAAAEVRTARDDPAAAVAALTVAGRRLQQVGARSDAIVESIAVELDIEMRPASTAPGPY